MSDALQTEEGLFNNQDFFTYAANHGFGELHCKLDPKTGMKSIIAIHSTKLGPALGGCRFIPYHNPMTALYDVMRLARGMSYKAALARLPLGGGKAVIIQPTTEYPREAYMRQFGKCIQELGGKYITALDSGTELGDMDIIAEETSYIATVSKNNGNPAPFTARGVYKGIEAAVQFKLEKDSLSGLHIAIQGLGHVGYLLAKMAYEAGARLTVADTNSKLVEQAVAEFNAQFVTPEVIHTVPCDVFAPCALGAVINDKTITELNTTIIAGAANNQLAHGYHGKVLHDKGIIYAPDYLINAGGLIFAASKYLHTPNHIVDEQIARIKTTLLEVFNRSVYEKKPTSEITDVMAQEILDKA